MRNRRENRAVILMQKGVRMPNPDAVDIGDEVEIDRISGNGVTIYPGCRIYGASTFIHDGAAIGYEAPVTVQDCYIGPDVQLKGGFFKQAVFLEKAQAGSGAHVREGTILEESASIAHTVGLKQTILFPFVTLGSLINFCDIFMSGGTSSKNHSEVGSSYIHFNYTPNQDKATASLLGNVPEGVMLNQRPIFLGGQGGLVGPCRLAFGTVVAAGAVCRKDENRSDRLLTAGGMRDGSVPFSAGIYRNIRRIVINNLCYLANLYALMQWYIHVRALFIGERFPVQLHEGLQKTLNMGIEERLKRLKALNGKMAASIEQYQAMTGDQMPDKLILRKRAFYERYDELDVYFRKGIDLVGDIGERDQFLQAVQTASAATDDYVSAIQQISEADSAAGTRWLSGIVHSFITGALAIIPEFGTIEDKS